MMGEGCGYVLQSAGMYCGCKDPCDSSKIVLCNGCQISSLEKQVKELKEEKRIEAECTEAMLKKAYSKSYSSYNFNGFKSSMSKEFYQGLFNKGTCPFCYKKTIKDKGHAGLKTCFNEKCEWYLGYGMEVDESDES